MEPWGHGNGDDGNEKNSDADSGNCVDGRGRRLIVADNPIIPQETAFLDAVVDKRLRGWKEHGSKENGVAKEILIARCTCCRFV